MELMPSTGSCPFHFIGAFSNSASGTVSMTFAARSVTRALRQCRQPGGLGHWRDAPRCMQFAPADLDRCATASGTVCMQLGAIRYSM